MTVIILAIFAAPWIYYSLRAWLSLRAERRAEREAAKQRHPSAQHPDGDCDDTECCVSAEQSAAWVAAETDPRNLPVAEYAVMVGAEKIAEDYARVELADDEFIYALVEVDRR